MPVTWNDVWNARYDGKGYHARKIRRAFERAARQTIRIEEGADFMLAIRSLAGCPVCGGFSVTYVFDEPMPGIGECVDCGATVTGHDLNGGDQ